ncbi:hypothetical protein GCM10023187_11930 [Nibrella viscosa]|uniref:Uncharacterized protein n=2 Tax=Nibrella viscosa TaxID=1084524 RepID=A0ABP8K2F2_9BACT
MTATRQQQGEQVLYSTVSDVKVNLLVYNVKIYYKTDCRFQDGQLMVSTVEARTNRGNFFSKTEWKGDHYDIVADQYKYKRQTTQKEKIDFSVTTLYFSEPVHRNKVFAEYFGDYFNVTKTSQGRYRTVFDDREDEYIYQQGVLTRIIKKNAVKNFVIRLLD